ITTVENAQGDGFGNYVFDNAINVTVGTDNEINAKKITLRQYNGTPGNGGGKITVAENAKLTISSQIAAHDSPTLVPLVKLGDGELVLSGDCTYTTGTFVYGGTLRLEKVGDKGTLATGSTVTVDGATSVLAGHGDILGYGGKTVGTVNLQNGGTLYIDTTGDHITVGAAVNMNSGFITTVENAQGDGFGNYVFDNAINVTGGTDNEISAYQITLRQYGDTPGNGGGKITVAENAKLTVSSIIRSEGVPLVKLGDGELVLSGDCTFTTGTYVNAGKLTLTKEGQKGTLATDSTVTVDGATSVLAGHGDILGYSGDTVGTVNLQNGGTLYNDATPEQAAHITVGAAVNMNGGFITADPAAQGDRFGNYVFDNAINATGGTDNAISANVISLRQYGDTPGNGGGKITVADGAKLTIGSLIKDPDSNYVPLVKQGTGNLVLTGENTYSTGTTISEGTLTLAGAGTTGAGTVAIGDSGTLEFYVTSNDAPKQVNISNANAISGTGKIVKSGNGVLRLNNETAEGTVSASNFLVSAGELDFLG
ncbi:MAG: autotransporter-associated beta strand repeat-containing protein, partial [Thermoguttaceae bacterium]|nr:autotransporter-associated beta strand repeat-containing protein [Thermoguttaceae bacterium]